MSKQHGFDGLSVYHADAQWDWDLRSLPRRPWALCCDSRPNLEQFLFLCPCVCVCERETADCYLGLWGSLSAAMFRWVKACMTEKFCE